jgi:hypothetical protein
MTTTLNTLQNITTGYTIFEKDQVLTEQQLNGVTDYLNDQTRLTRINALGVGIAAGLRVAQQGSTVHLSKGIGITTDGDLLYYTSDVVFDRFVEYDNSYPRYAPFFDGDIEGTMLAVYELIPQGVDDPRTSFLLSQFAAQTAKNLNAMVAVLLMESYENDPDLCTGTGCDNLGKNCLNTPKLILIEKTSVGALLNPAIATPDEAYSQLASIVSDRPILPSTVTAFSQLVQVYRTACTQIHAKLLTELAKVYPNCVAFLEDSFTTNPITDWTTRLTAFQTTANSDGSRIQYYYDFLKDLVETYNLFRELLFGDTTWCCPDVTWFPKHLLLGDLTPDSNAGEHRTAFYPSPIVSHTVETLEHAKFLLQKLDTLIKTFQFPPIASNTPIRITPSQLEDQPLEARAIPYYYQVNTTTPIHTHWSYYLHQRGMDAFNYSYNADAYGAQGGSANPLTSQIGAFSFFRIEGHLGQSLSTATSAISGLIQSRNLPFAVLTATLGDGNQVGDMNFADLLSQSPELEHFAGVARGGTFVLLADTNGMVIADFMLPYLPRQRSGSICSLLIRPTDNVGQILSSIADGQDAHICFQAGTYTLSSRLLLQNKGHLTITGSGKGTRIIAPGLESVLEFNACKSVSISNCHLENAIARTGILTGFASNTEDLRGILTFINCPSVDLEKLSLRCAHQVVRSASCITVRQDLSVTNTQVRVRHCDLQVGYQQIGMLLINVERSQLTDNQIQVDRSNAATTLTTLATMPEYRLRLLPRLVANAYLGNAKPQGGGATSTRFDECNVTVNFSNQSVRFKTETNLVNQWQTLVNARSPFVQSRRDLLNFIKQLAREILLLDSVRNGLPIFNNWYQSINKQSTIIASQGIVVAGSRAQEVRLLNNTIQGFLQGIHIGVSPRTSYRAGSVLITGNRIEVSAPVDQICERHGIYISSCDSLMIQNNYLQAIAASLPIEGIRVSGRLGRMSLIRQNHLVGFNPNAIYFRPMDAYGTEKMQWLIADNIAANSQLSVKLASNLPGTPGTQVVAKVRNSDNFQ